MKQKLEALELELRADLKKADSRDALEGIRIKYLGRKGHVMDLFQDMGKLSAEEKPKAGKGINRFKQLVQDGLKQRQVELGKLTKQKSLNKAGTFDITLPSVRRELGRLHPITLVIDEISSLFVEMGFQIVEGPEIETEYYNFEALNIPLEHPSREAFDTFYLDASHVLRSHTSPVQVRAMEKLKPPLRVLVPGKVYRPDAVDASHSFMFHQVEGLLVDENISMAHLKGFLSVFARKLFGEQTLSRFRPHFFPFTEPSVEVDVTCILCQGKGCRVCKGSGWLEILGAGMVHPRVLEAGKIDSSKYSGFAFGMGIERVAMLKYGIEDIRLFYENDLKFNRQFGG